MFGHGKATFSFSPPHRSPSSMRTGTERFTVAKALDNICPRTHRTRYNTQITKLRTNRTFASDHNIFSIVPFPCDVVVVTVDSLGNVIHEPSFVQCLHYVLEHDQTIIPCKLLR